MNIIIFFSIKYFILNLSLSLAYPSAYMYIRNVPISMGCRRCWMIKSFFFFFCAHIYFKHQRQQHILLICSLMHRSKNLSGRRRRRR